jgi:hypothetical protein
MVRCYFKREDYDYELIFGFIVKFLDFGLSFLPFFSQVLAVSIFNPKFFISSE